MSNFNNYKKFENVGTRSSNETLIIMNSSNNNISLHSSDGGDDNVDTLSIKNIINKTPNEDLNLSSLTGTTINPVITINNNHSDCRIKTNLNVYGNVNINNNLIIPTHNKNSNLLSNTYGSIYYNTTENTYEGYSNEGWVSLSGFSKTKDATIYKNLNVDGNINLTNGEMIKTSGIGSFGSINSGVGTFKNLNISGNLNLPVGITSSRPSNPNPGTIRYNSETHKFEGYTDKWVNFIYIVKLYNFTSHTFTNCSATGRNGPTVINCRASYTETWTDNDSYFNVVNGIQHWTVPFDGDYTIAAYGADAIRNHNSQDGGRGAIISGTFTLTVGEKIYILVGQRPEPYDSNTTLTAGAGGTFVVRAPYNTNESILVIAGGGGGRHPNMGGLNTEGHGNAHSSGSDGLGASAGTGGTNGNAGVGRSGTNNEGAGFYGAPSSTDAAVSFTNSVNPGRGGLGNIIINGNYGEGGFGGGGRDYDHTGGGGGGYSGGGGAGSSSPYQGGGGGSYNNGSNQSNIGGWSQPGAISGWDGQGKVEITFIS